MQTASTLSTADKTIQSEGDGEKWRDKEWAVVYVRHIAGCRENSVCCRLHWTHSTPDSTHSQHQQQSCHHPHHLLVAALQPLVAAVLCIQILILLLLYILWHFMQVLLKSFFLRDPIFRSYKNLQSKHFHNVQERHLIYSINYLVSSAVWSGFFIGLERNQDSTVSDTSFCSLCFWILILTPFTELICIWHCIAFLKTKCGPFPFFKILPHWRSGNLQLLSFFRRVFATHQQGLRHRLKSHNQ